MTTIRDYWFRPEGPPDDWPERFRARDSNKFITFELDCGGFNNIRMQFEYACILAALHGRTLVLPPPDAWYLINWGPITREGDYGGVCHHSEFFDIPHLSRWINVITTEDFVCSLKGQCEFPAECLVLGSQSEAGERDSDRLRARKDWQSWLRNNVRMVHWNPNENLLYHPDPMTVNSGTHKPDDRFVSHRTSVTIQEQDDAAPILHLPCDTDRDIRHLGQISKCVACADPAEQAFLFSLLRNGIRFRAELFSAAWQLVNVLGVYRYSSLHLRRNDIQFEESKTSSETTAQHINNSLAPGESLYIATDETDEEFLEQIGSGRQVFRFADLLRQAKINTIAPPVPDKHIGCIEQLVCAAGRKFIGTSHSTFSTYIRRLRGYGGAPDTNEYFHTDNPSESRSFGFLFKTPCGRNYMQEDPALWERPKFDSAFYSVTCTDNQDYGHWQCELLEYSWKQVGQYGELLRLVSCSDDTPLPAHPYTRVIRTAFTNVHPETGDEYIPYNRLYSFREWLRSDPAPGTVLILDPDCVFKDRVTQTVEPGSPVAQPWAGGGVFELGTRWGDPLESLTNVDFNKIQGVTWPLLIHTDDLSMIIDRWIELTAALRTAIQAWESDMVAFIVAAAEFELIFAEKHLVAVLPFPEEQGEAPLVHYCQPVIDGKGEILWNKQGYKPWTAVDVDPSTAFPSYAGDLLAILQEYISHRSNNRSDVYHPEITLDHEVAATLPEQSPSSDYLVKVGLASGTNIAFRCAAADQTINNLYTFLAENAERSHAHPGEQLSVLTQDGKPFQFFSSQIISLEIVPDSTT